MLAVTAGLVGSWGDIMVRVLLIIAMGFIPVADTARESET